MRWLHHTSFISDLQDQGKTDNEIKTRILIGRRAKSLINSVLCSKNIKTNIKKLINNTIIESIVLSGGDTSTISKKMKRNY